jgi:competence protein ComEA
MEEILIKYRFWIISFLFLISFLGITTYFFIQEPSTRIDELLSQDTRSEIELEIVDIYVDVKGEVAKPGVYSLKIGSIVDDAIKTAGGLTKNAYVKNINLSKKLVDEQVLYIYSIKEYNNLKTKTKPTEIINCNPKTVYIDDCINIGAVNINDGKEETNTIPVENETNEVISKIININTATQQELMTLTGIGEAKADDIIMYRLKNGPFKTIDELKNVSGIGDKTFDKIKDLITV